MSTGPLPDLEVQIKKVVEPRGAPHFPTRTVIFHFENDTCRPDDEVTLKCVPDTFDIRTKVFVIERCEIWPAAVLLQSIYSACSIL